jgi:hypothetical protein
MIFFFFFFFFPPEKLPEVAGVGRPVAVDGGWQRQLVAGDGCWTQIIGLETCIESLIGELGRLNGPKFGHNPWTIKYG